MTGYKYVVSHIPISKKRRPGRKIVPQYLTIHSTGNEKSTARNERAWLENPDNTRAASWHVCVDEKEAIEAIPFDEMAYHAGTYAGNLQSIGIEICESGDRRRTLDNAARLAARLLAERGWGVDRLRRHYDWSRKNCPRILSANNWAGWEQFKSDVKRFLVMEVLSMFRDVPSNYWAAGSIERVAKLGVMSGDSQNNFRPNDPVTRAELASVIDRVLKLIGK